LNIGVRRAISLTGARQVSVAQIALAWLLAKPFVTSVIIGAKSMDRLRDNVASTRVRLDDAEMKQLDEISALPPQYPEWMIAYQGQARLKVPAKE
jgi:aryl-alcohol dehydrogenase-like predicted oxidoreductase